MVPRPRLVLGLALEELSAIDEKSSFLCVAGALRRSGAGIRRCQSCSADWRWPSRRPRITSASGTAISGSILHLIRDRGDAVSLRRRFQPGIHQIWLPELGVVDRCTTCHLGLNETSLADVHRQPFRKHPVIPHSLDGFGCVICHGGQGAATTVAEAHHSERAGEEPILPARYIESGCGQCHQNALPGTPQLNLGRTHADALRLRPLPRHHASLTGRESWPQIILRRWLHIADKTTREWIYSWLKDPQAYAASTTMPNYKLSDADASDISAYLVSSSTPHAGDTAAAGVQACGKRRSNRRGRACMANRSASSCHAVQNAAGNLVGGDVGPELTRIGNKAKPEWLAAWLQNPRIYDATTPMPHYRFTPQQIAILAALSTEQVGFRLRLGGSSGCGQRAADCPRTETHRRAGMRGLPRDQRRAEAGELRARTQHHRKQAAGADSSFCPAWSTHCPVTSWPRSASREPSAPA